MRSSARLASPLLCLVAAACDAPPADVTFSADVAPLLERHCASCHQEGGIAPFALTTYDQAKAQAQAIATVTAARLMPPSPIDASGACRDFADARWLTDEEIDVLRRWADADAPEGEAVDVTPPALDTLDDADLVVSMPEAYTPKASDAHPNDDYRCFLLPAAADADRFLQGFEILPGDPAEVHHMLLFSLLDDGAVAQVQQMDDNDEGPGWECFSTPFDDSTSFLGGWAPGDNTVLYPEGTGVFMAGGKPLVMQIHYNLLSGARPDLTSLKLKTVASVQAEAAVAPIADTDLALPPGQREALAGDSFALAGLADDLLVHGVFPHMHQLGSTLRLWVTPLGDRDDETCLVDVWRWDFHWQQMALYDAPLVVRASDEIHIACSFDTTSRDETVYWGEGTQDEMCLAFVYVTRVNGGPLSGLVE